MTDRMTQDEIDSECNTIDGYARILRLVYAQLSDEALDLKSVRVDPDELLSDAEARRRKLHMVSRGDWRERAALRREIARDVRRNRMLKGEASDEEG